MLRRSLLPLLAVLYGCSGTGPTEAAPTTTVVPAHAAIAKVVSRDRTITLLAGGGTVRATVLDADGRLIAHDVPLDDLQRIDATAYDVCGASYAGGRESLDSSIPPSQRGRGFTR